MRVRVSSPARSDLAAIWAYSSATWGDAQADAYVDRLRTRFQWLAGNERLWRPRPELAAGIFGWTERSHLILFRRFDRGIEIVRVLHARMDIDRHR